VFRPPVIDIYARISKIVDTGELIKVDDQVEMGTEALERRGAVAGEVFKDPSLSAWDPDVVRPDWDRLMARLESGLSDGVWVYDLTRWTRKVSEGERLIELAEQGVRVWSNSGEYDLTTADGRKQFRDAVVTAAAESDKISERSRRGKLRRARKGRLQGGGRGFAAPGWVPKSAGWEPGDPRERVPEEQLAEERAVIRECYERIFAGDGLGSLVADLRERGYRFTRSSLSRTLQRPVLAGLLEHNGQILGTAVGVTAAVERAEWERMCGLFAGRRRGRPPGRVHVLSGRMRCGRCGCLMTGFPRRGKGFYADGSPRREYRCGKSVDHPERCGRNHIDALVAEQAVAEAVVARLGDPRRAERIAAASVAMREQRAALEGELANLNETADRLATKTAAWGVERVDAAMVPILERVGEIHSELAGLAEPETAEAAAADAAQAWTDAMQRRDFDAMRVMVKRAFPRLALRPQSGWNDHSAERIDLDGECLQGLKLAS
jgi:DNA invertase Pin-like site-specific DNA recombinase